MQAGGIAGGCEAPEQALASGASLGELIFGRLARRPEEIVSVLVRPDGSELPVTAGLLARRAAGFARRLGRPQGRRRIVAITLYQGLDLHAAWIGTVWAGHIPTMVAPPSMRMEPAKFAGGFRGIMERIKADLLIIDRATAEKLGSQIAGLPSAVVAEEVAEAEPADEPARLAPDDVALIQHSSGSTGLQKAVALTNRQVLEHNAAYCRTLGISPRDTIVSWLPLYHDMGFVACFLLPLLHGIRLVEMSPFDWVLRPQMLFQAISRHRGTLCWLPNFAFSFMAQSVKLEPGAEHPDLSSIRAWINCSEPVMASSMRKFVERFEPLGAGWRQMSASYAMAENVFAATQTQPGGIRELTVDRNAFINDHAAAPVADGAVNAMVFVSSGKPLPTTELQIRGDNDERIENGQVGEIWLRGTHRFSGYFGSDELTRAAIDAEGWYKTGDLGFIHDGDLFVTGRSKDLIIIQGRNFYPNDIERSVGEIEGISVGRVVAFGLPDEATGTEQLIVLAEAGDASAGDPHVLALRVRNCVAQEFNCTPADARVVPPRWLVKSTSGKPARADNRAKYIAEFREGRDV
jgi:acyl-CoA synthetase (AMP-forming)/AMP-acid ligase II